MGAYVSPAARSRRPRPAKSCWPVPVHSKDSVDGMNTAAAAQFGKSDVNPLQDHDFMYSRALADPDGHIWEAFWMDPAAIEAARCG